MKINHSISPKTFSGKRTRQKILLIENDLPLREILIEIFADYLFSVKGFEYTENLHELALRFQPDIIIVDYLLPKINGDELCRQIKTKAETATIPVILFSAFDNAVKSKEASNWDAFIAKPFDLDELIKTIKRLIFKRKNNTQLHPSRHL
ncbi:response regulator [Pedobacter sp.]|uniref:response regulator transcription factor n=1 Tax=Pedobacter sp. TaxID=1411316 RepID=UPI0031D28829